MRCSAPQRPAGPAGRRSFLAGLTITVLALAASAASGNPAVLLGLRVIAGGAGALGIAIFGAIAGTPTNPSRFITGLHHLVIFNAALWLLAILVTQPSLTRAPPHQQ